MKKNIIKQMTLLLGVFFINISFASDDTVSLKVYPAYGGKAYCLNNYLACSVTLQPTAITGDVEDVIITNNSPIHSARNIIVTDAPPEQSGSIFFGFLPDPPFTGTVIVYNPSAVPGAPPTPAGAPPCFTLANGILPPNANCSIRFSSSPGASPVSPPVKLTIKGDNTQAVDVFVTVQ